MSYCKGPEFLWAQGWCMERIPKRSSGGLISQPIPSSNMDYWRQGTIKASAHQHPSFIALRSNPVLICDWLEKCVIHENYLITCLRVSFQDSLDNSVTGECTPEEADSSENSLHPDFAKVIKLTQFMQINVHCLLLNAFMKKIAY